MNKQFSNVKFALLSDVVVSQLYKKKVNRVASTSSRLARYAQSNERTRTNSGASQSSERRRALQRKDPTGGALAKVADKAHKRVRSFPFTRLFIFRQNSQKSKRLCYESDMFLPQALCVSLFGRTKVSDVKRRANLLWKTRKRQMLKWQ